MPSPLENFDRSIEARLTRERVQPLLVEIFEKECGEQAEESLRQFCERLDANWDQLFDQLFELYGNRYDMSYHTRCLVEIMVKGWLDREEVLHQIDNHRIYEPDWHLSNEMVGGALYVDLFSDTLNGLREKINYFKEMGITYVHLMPLFAERPGNSDGGYAISDYRAVNDELGTIEDLKNLATEFREEGISVVLDFVFNHTADNHDWAKQAHSGELKHENFYYLFPDKTVPDQYEQNLREIFPTIRRGNFTWDAIMQKWVWTTFNSFQWDLNYRNPEVFNAMIGEMIFLANTGVDVLRLDAVAFIWKQMGTSCENLPETHQIIRTFNTVRRIVCPALLFKSEAIVHPDDVVKYIDEQECQLSYNPLLMALLWETLATREVKLLEKSMSYRHALPENCAWMNYLRCHDDIGWTFDDGDAASLGINAYDHRKFLNHFYTGVFPGSFARGVPFQHNKETGDMRVSGTMASLAGLEEALEKKDKALIEHAVNRIFLLHNVILTIGGIPLLYMGEEWGVLNDYNYVNDPDKQEDSRWVHRPKMDWKEVQKKKTINRRIFEGIKRLIHLRKALPALAGMKMEVFSFQNKHVLAYIREHQGQFIYVISNFSEHSQTISGRLLRSMGVCRHYFDHVSGETISTVDDFVLSPHQFLWLEKD